MTNQIIRETVDNLHQAFDEFKTVNDQRLRSIENKKIDEGHLNEKVNRLRDKVEKAENHLKNLETAIKRPLYSSPGDSSERDESGKAAFFHYMRKGTEGFDQKSLTSLSDASGGYLIPHTMLAKIHSSMVVTSPMRSLARVTTISTDALELLQDKGTAEVGWVAETADRPETETPELRKIRIPVHEIYAKPRASQKLLDDATVDIEGWLAQKIAEKMTITENEAFIKGTGQGKPTGFLNYEVVQIGKGEWGKIEAVAAKTREGAIEGDVLMEVFHTLKAQYLANATWVMSRSALAAIRKFKDASGRYLWQTGLSEKTPTTLLGCPVVLADDMPVLENDKPSTPIAFGNFYEAYQIVDRAGLHLLRDPFSAKPYVEFYATKRVGGDVINFDALKLIHFTKD